MLFCTASSLVISFRFNCFTSSKKASKTTGFNRVRHSRKNALPVTNDAGLDVEAGTEAGMAVVREARLAPRGDVYFDDEGDPY